MNVNQKLNPGTVISVPKSVIKHVGLITDNYWQGKPTVIANTPKYGHVIEQTLDDFCDGLNYMVVSVPQDYLIGLKAVSKARRLIGKPYSLFAYNCEHLINDAYSFKPQSPQLKRWSLGLIISAGLLITLTNTQ